MAYSFYTSDIIGNIPDIKAIYDINDEQASDIDTALTSLDNDLYLTTMEEARINDWEVLLDIQPLDADTLTDRRARIKTYILSQECYTDEVFRRKFYALFGDDYTLYIDRENEFIRCRIPVSSYNMMDYVTDFLEEMVPLNMVMDINLKYNTHSMLSAYTHSYLAGYTQEQMHSTPFK